MVFKRFVQIGRVCYINYGEDLGKVCVILDVVDQNKALIDSPMRDLSRKQITIRRLTLTDILIRVPRNARPSTLAKIFEKEDVMGRWQKSNYAQKLQRQQKKASMTDFERFTDMISRKKRSAVIKKEMAQLRKGLQQ